MSLLLSSFINKTRNPRERTPISLVTQLGLPKVFSNIMAGLGNFTLGCSWILIDKDEEGVCSTVSRLGEKLGRRVKDILVGPILDSGFFLEGDTGYLFLLPDFSAFPLEMLSYWAP